MIATVPKPDIPPVTVTMTHEEAALLVRAAMLIAGPWGLRLQMNFSHEGEAAQVRDVIRALGDAIRFSSR